MPDASAEAVISSLVLCTVRDPAAVLAEVRRILSPGRTVQLRRARRREAGHADPVVTADHASPVGLGVRRLFLRTGPGWLIGAAGFASVDLDHYRIHSLFLPFNTHIAGTAIA